MPIYEYQCDACEHRFENIQKVSDALLEECPECGKRALRKLVSAAAFRLKGTGWYATDFKDKPAGRSKSDTEKTDSDKVQKKEEKPSSASSNDTEGSKAKKASTKKATPKTD